MDEHCKQLGIPDSPKSWGDITNLTPHPQTLFYCVFPKLAKFVEKRPHLMSANYATTDGHTINFLFVNKRLPLKSDRVRGPPLGIPAENLADSAVEGRIPWSRAAGVRRLGGGLNRRVKGQVTRTCGLLDLEKEIANGTLKKGILLPSTQSELARRHVKKR